MTDAAVPGSDPETRLLDGDLANFISDPSAQVLNEILQIQIRV